MIVLVSGIGIILAHLFNSKGLKVLGVAFLDFGLPNRVYSFIHYSQHLHPITIYRSSLIRAAFSYVGTEITALTAGEAKNPKKTLPSAIKGVAYRICAFYILGTLVVGLLVPSNDPRLNLNSHDAASSPFVIAIQNSGIKALPSIINAALLSSAWSAASSDMYTSSRALYALALSGSAPAIFKRTTSWGLPWPSLIVTFMVGLLAYMSVGAGTAGQVFSWLANMLSVCGLISWTGTFFTYLRFDAGVKAQNIDRNLFPYKSPVRTIGAIYGLVLCCLFLLTNSFTVFVSAFFSNLTNPAEANVHIPRSAQMKGQWDTATFITGYFPILNAVFLYTGSYWYFKKQGLRVSMIPLHELVSLSFDKTKSFDQVTFVLFFPKPKDFVTEARDELRDGVDEEKSTPGGARVFIEKFKTVKLKISIERRQSFR
ncbi:hypothetical protein O181_011901 [Austropuccinia psidii MF-1]|uniref:Amino acid permease/ SLC12A domain-containing protein n=1 Tax=Austropuccinia psidii MF-1 TaxID=1389203 RepID=A0A9Q3BTL8_9BASI|nr:hypothetical protein [Austropuccinia psidii MF-1]